MPLQIISFNKTFSLEYLITLGIPFLIAYFSPLMPILTGMVALTFIDTFTGTWAAAKRKESIHSRAMARTITKTVMYTIAVILAHILETVFMNWFPAVNLIAGYIALVEFKSNMENIGYITNIDIWNYIKDRIEIFKPKDEG